MLGLSVDEHVDVCMRKKSMSCLENTECVGKWGMRMYLCEVTVVAGGMISRSDRKCLCRWNSNADTLRMVYRKQPTLQLCVCVRSTLPAAACYYRKKKQYICM